MHSYISSIGTAVPQFRIAQADIASHMAKELEMDERQAHDLQVLYRASGISFRHSFLPDFAGAIDNGDGFFKPEASRQTIRGTAERMAVYKKEAPLLAAAACRDCFAGISTLRPAEVTHFITVSCTGMYAPGLDIDLVRQLGLSPHVRRTNIGFMGCYAAFTALKLADQICNADREAKVLVVCVELCTLHFQHGTDRDTLLSGGLFADGAAALLVQGTRPPGRSMSPINFHCDLLSDGAREMAWEVGDQGFDMRLSAYVPDLIRLGISSLTDGLLAALPFELSDIAHFAIHPGGKRILNVIEEGLSIPREMNRPSHAVLRDFGNMSSPTVLFVLKRIWQQLDADSGGEKILSFAFGPGLTLESAVLEVNT